MHSKALIATATIGLIGGTSAYASQLFGTEKPIVLTSIPTPAITFETKLRQEGFEVLDTNKDSEKWKEVLEEYKKATTRSFTGAQEAEITEEQLRNKCASALKVDSKTGNGYSLTRQWCVKKEAMSDVFKRGKRRVLSNKIKRDQELWEKKLKEFQKDPSKFKNINYQIGGTEEVPFEDATGMQKWCEKLEINKIETTDNMFETNFKLAWKICTVKEPKGVLNR